jgi:hypothetical protein
MCGDGSQPVYAADVPKVDSSYKETSLGSLFVGLAPVNGYGRANALPEHLRRCDMRRTLILWLTVASMIAVPARTVSAEETVSQDPTLVTYEFEWVVTEVTVNQVDYPNVPEVSVGDTGTGAFTIADWPLVNPSPEYPCFARPTSLTGFKAELSIDGDTWPLNTAVQVNIFNDCAPAFEFEDGISMGGNTGTPWLSGFVGIGLVTSTADIWDSYAPDVLGSVDPTLFDAGTTGIAWWDWYNDPQLPWALVGAITTLTTASPEDLLADLVEEVEHLNIHHGIANSLDAKLQAVVKALDDVTNNNDGAASNQLESFINEVAAQSGKKIPAASAQALVSSAHQIIRLLAG